MIAIEKRIEFCQNLGYDGKNPLLDALINLREQIVLTKKNNSGSTEGWQR